ncbi:MAG: hypothetical protein KDA75_01010 [Planctomycetaceae bacterium]|nr:hypothetical protein [Planctomycetaceae bacterium]
MSLLLACWGCSHPSDGVIVEADRRHPPLLLSDLQSAPHPGDLINSEFVFQNTDSTEARLRFVGSGCSCYAVTSNGRPLKRGEELLIPGDQSLPVEIGMNVAKDVGERLYTAEFEWVKSNQEVVSLPISLSIPVYADFQVIPHVLTAAYRADRPIDPQTMTVTVCGRSANEVAVQPVASGADGFVALENWRKANTEQLRDDLWRAEWEAEVRFTVPEGYRQQVSTSLRISGSPEVADSVRSTLVSVLIEPQFGVRSPGSVQLGMVRPDLGVHRRVLLAAADDVPFRILDVQSSDPRCTARTTADEASPRQWLEVSADLSEGDELDAELTCTTDHPESPQVTLPVRGKVVRSRD